MPTKFLTALAAATLLTIGSTAVAFAEAADINSTFNQDQTMDASQAIGTQSTTPTAGWSAHYHPTGVVHK